MTGSIGGGLGGILGDILGVALAPETGGLSLALPVGLGALGGVGGNLLGDAIGGQKVDPLGVALSGAGGAAGGFAGSELFGGAEALGGAPLDAATFPSTSGIDAAIGGAAAGAGGDLLGAGAGAAEGAVPGAVSSSLGAASPAFMGTLDAGTPIPSIAPTAGGVGGQTALASADPFGTGGVIAQGGGEGGSLGVVNNPAAAGGAAAPGGAASSSAPALTGSGTLDPSVFPSTSGIDMAASGGTGVSPLSGSVNPVQPGLGELLKGGYGGLKEFLKDNSGPLSLGIGGLGLGKALLEPNAIPGGTPQAGSLMLQNGQFLQNAGQTLVGEGMRGQNTPGIDQNFMQTANANKASIRAKYANMGLSGSSAEKQDLAAIDAQIAGAQGQAAQTTLNSGLTALNMSGSPVGQAAIIQAQQDSDLTNALAALAWAAGGGGSQGATAGA